MSLEQTLVFLASLEMLVPLREESEAKDGLADEQRAAVSAATEASLP